MGSWKHIWSRDLFLYRQIDDDNEGDMSTVSSSGRNRIRIMLPGMFNAEEDL